MSNWHHDRMSKTILAAYGFTLVDHERCYAKTIDGEWVSEEELAAAPVAERNENGHLLCQACRCPFSYAEPTKSGHFVCRGCRG